MSINDLISIDHLAVWGAITGTIGTGAGLFNLWLRYRQHRTDQPKLRCQVEFKFERNDGVPRPSFKINIRSVGRRPVNVECVRFMYKPKRRLHSVFRWYHWSIGRWAYSLVPPVQISLSEGTMADVGIKLPDWLPITDVLRVEVWAQSGAKWRVKWPRGRRLKGLTQHEVLFESTIEKSSKIVGASCAGRLYVFARASVDGRTFQGKYFYCEHQEDYDKRLRELRDAQDSNQLQSFLLPQ